MRRESLPPLGWQETRPSPVHPQALRAVHPRLGARARAPEGRAVLAHTLVHTGRGVGREGAEHCEVPHSGSPRPLTHSRTALTGGPPASTSPRPDLPVRAAQHTSPATHSPNRRWHRSSGGHTTRSERGLREPRAPQCHWGGRVRVWTLCQGLPPGRPTQGRNVPQRQYQGPAP